MPVATITAEGPTTFCPGGSVRLTASQGASYLWSTGVNTPFITVNNAGNYTVTVTSDQGCTATSAVTTVSIADTKAPVVPQLPAITAECAVTVSPINGTDDCAGTIIPVTADPLSYTVQGTYTIHWTYSDGNGNPTLKEQTVIIKDVTAPMFIAPAARNVALGAGCSVVMPNLLTGLSGMDNCSGTVTFTQSPAAGNIVSAAHYQAITVIITAEDANGNSTSKNIILTAKDLSNPVITAPAALTIATNTGQCSAANVALGTPVFGDNCPGVNISNNAPAVFTKGITTVTWTATDVAGNTATATQTVTVQDVEKPVITCPVAPVIFCNAPGGTYSIAPLSATDNCGIATTTYAITGATVRSGTGNNASGSFNPGSSTISWTVTDMSGNVSTCQTVVVVNSYITISIPDVKALSSGVDANTVYRGYAPAASITLTATVSGGSGAYTYSWSTGATTASINVNPAAATTYTVTVKDAKGCTNTASKQIKVTDVRCGNKMDKVSICHTGGNTNCIGSESVSDHLAHGDYLGACRSNSNSTTSTTAMKVPEEIMEERGEDLSVTVSPNPSHSYFTLQIRSADAKDGITIRVMDAAGRLIEIRKAVAAQSLQIGASYRPGLYYAQFVQGNRRVTLKLVKQSN